MSPGLSADELIRRPVDSRLMFLPRSFSVLCIRWMISRAGLLRTMLEITMTSSSVNDVRGFHPCPRIAMKGQKTLNVLEELPTTEMNSGKISGRKRLNLFPLLGKEIWRSRRQTQIGLRCAAAVD